MQNENENTTETSDCRTTKTTELFQSSQSPLDPHCSVCNSGKINEIHKLRKTLTLRDLSEALKKSFDLDFSKDVLARHFIHYTKILNQESTKTLLAKFNQEIENVSEHQKKTLFLAKISFDHIVERIESGTLQLGVDDFEKMIKLYYSVLRNPDSQADDNIIAIFQRASEKYGCGLEQGVLIKTGKKAPLEGGGGVD